MRKCSAVICILVLLLVTATVAQAVDVQMYIDTGPDVWNTTLFSAWTPGAYAAAADGTYVNMGGGTYPGTTVFIAEEAIVYSWGDNGNMLLWTFWIPGKTTTELTGNIQYRYRADWEGVEYTYGWYDIPNTSRANAWQDYTNSANVSGVVGAIGCAWEVTGDYSDVEQLAADMYAYQTYFAADIQVREDAESSWETYTLTGQLTPEPTGIIALLAGLCGVVSYRRFRK